MHLAVVQVDIERAIVGEHPVRLAQPRLEEGKVVVEGIGKGPRAHLDGLVALSLEADPIPRGAAHGLDPRVGLGLARVERRVDVDEGDGAVRDVAPEDVEVFAVVNGVHSPISIGRRAASGRMLGGEGGL